VGEETFDGVETGASWQFNDDLRAQYYLLPARSVLGSILWHGGGTHS
jgi:hypothetical protein